MRQPPPIVPLTLLWAIARKPMPEPPADDSSDTPEDTDPVADTDETDPVVDTDDSDPPNDTDPPDDTDPLPDTDDTDPPDTDDTDPPDTDDTDPPDTWPGPDTDIIDTRLGDTGAPADDTDPPSGETGDSAPADDTYVWGDSTPSSDTDDSARPPPTPWRAPLRIDGDPSDCPLGARFQTTSGVGPWACITWDDDNLYIGFHHPDVSAGGPTHYLWLYAGGRLTTGASDGVVYNTQQPALSPVFQTHIRWRATHTFNSKLSWTGAAWADERPSYLFTSGSVAESHANDTVEMRIPLADLTQTTVLPLAIGWLFAGTGAERTYAGVPVIAFTDGYNPDITAWYTFNLTSSAEPNTYLPVTSP